MVIIRVKMLFAYTDLVNKPKNNRIIHLRVFYSIVLIKFKKKRGGENMLSRKRT